MYRFPDAINICVKNTDNEPISNVMLMVRLFARRKNDYYVVTSTSDEKGTIVLTREDCQKSIEIHKHLYIMDYSSDLYDCEPKIEVGLMGENRIQSVVREWDMMNSFVHFNYTREDLLAADNLNYMPVVQLFDLIGNENTYSFDLITKSII